MEMSNRGYNLRSLPGGRRGASGADAGCHSMRTIGGVELSKRAPTKKHATAGRSELNRRAQYEDATADSTGDDTISLFSSIPSTRPSYMTRSKATSSTTSTLDSVARDVDLDRELAPTTSAHNKRKRWTPEMNIFILRTYFQLTLLDTDKTTYLEPLHLRFLEKFPYMQVSRQRIGDQRRAIINNKLLSQETIDTIRNEVEKELNQLQLNRTNQQTGNTINQSQPIFTHSQSHPTAVAIQNKTLTRMRWTNEQNEGIMRSYYRVTDLGRNETVYRKRMYDDFISYFPSLAHLSEQRIADQRRAIVNNKYISDDKLNSLKAQVAQELLLSNHNSHNSRDTFTDNRRINNPITQLTNNIEIHCTEDPTPDTQIVDNTELNTILDIDITPTPQTNQERDTLIDETFQQALEHFKTTSPTNRNYIPKQKPSKNLARIVSYLNQTILPENVDRDTNFNTFQTIIYCAAWTAAKVNGARISLEPREGVRTQKKEYRPKWQRRLEKKLKDLRTKIGRMTQYVNGNRSRKLRKYVNKIMKTYRTHTIHEEPNTQPLHTLDTLKQKLSVVKGRLERYTACTLRKRQNFQFNHNEKLFYRNMKQVTTNNNQHNTPRDNENNTPDPETLQHFWANIWERPVCHNSQADWIQSDLSNSTQPMTFEQVPIAIFHKVLSKLHNWKAPGSDHIHSYWYKKFTAIHSYLYNFINLFIQDPELLPSYLTSGITFMIPKDPNDLSNPAKYRPITCLQTLYKIITSCISELMYEHIDANNILAEQQKGCRRFSQGCKEQLIIDSIVLGKVNKSKSDLYSMYIDYKKAYDSVPHSWLVRKFLQIDAETIVQSSHNHNPTGEHLA
ncbi:uncharacterized protein LOC126911787 [Spodoptera frugiperda]|uniref:Uncharacterized protein LOC126911787 n=1 Tax=Spodoptera frugiperda TaxID=7108 RepID=A0A9R0DZP3_SPOFR|nr:uncharacterized protein LOC126911787 [Spodoptera frugiperda]